MRLNIIIPVLSLCFLLPKAIFAHCQIPCGIYDDQMRINMISEHIDTIEKSIKSILRLENEKNIDYNQLVRWISNKEKHAGYIQEIVADYFLDQRIKPIDKNNPAYAKYLEELVDLHNLSFLAMKAKQSTDLKNVEALRKTLEHFRKLYFQDKDKKSE